MRLKDSLRQIFFRKLFFGKANQIQKLNNSLKLGALTLTHERNHLFILLRTERKLFLSKVESNKSRCPGY